MMPSALYGPTFSPWMNTFTRTTRATPPLCTATSFSAIWVDADLPFGVANRGSERLTALDGVAPGDQRVERRLERIAGGGGEEADPPKVDPEDRGLACRRGAGRRAAGCRRRRR